MDPDFAKLDEHIRQTVRDYIEHRYDPGDFLMAVLSNDLMGAFGHADLINRRNLYDTVEWLYNEAPGGCWGSAKKVRDWLMFR